MADEERSIQIGPIQVPEFLKSTYSNFVNVNHTPWDFRLMFAIVKTPVVGERSADEGQGVVVNPEMVAEVILPANLMHGLISALQDNFEKYLNQYGPPGLDPEGPQFRQDGE